MHMYVNEVAHFIYTYLHTKICEPEYTGKHNIKCLIEAVTTICLHFVTKQSMYVSGSL
jgi:phosphoribosylaminoimidazole-succinocarboxamide synthase